MSVDDTSTMSLPTTPSATFKDNELSKSCPTTPSTNSRSLDATSRAAALPPASTTNRAITTTHGSSSDSITSSPEKASLITSMDDLFEEDALVIKTPISLLKSRVTSLRAGAGAGAGADCAAELSPLVERDEESPTTY